MSVAPQKAEPGEPLTVTITVTNQTKKDLTDVSVVSRSAPDCSRPDLGTLGPGQAVTYSCDGGKAQQQLGTFEIAATATSDGVGYYSKTLRTNAKAVYTVTPSPTLPDTGSTAASGLTAAGLGFVVLGVLALVVSMTWRRRAKER